MGKIGGRQGMEAHACPHSPRGTWRRGCIIDEETKRNIYLSLRMSRSWVDPCGAHGERERLSEGQQSEAGPRRREEQCQWKSSVCTMCVYVYTQGQVEDEYFFSGQQRDFLEGKGSRPGRTIKHLQTTDVHRRLGLKCTQESPTTFLSLPCWLWSQKGTQQQMNWLIAVRSLILKYLFKPTI